MTTWTWECLLDGATGTSDTQEGAESDAQAHNEEEDHESPQISYGHDDPEPTPVPDPTTTEVIDAITNASDFTDAQARLAALLQ